MSEGPERHEQEEISDAAGMTDKVDPKVKNRRIYYARRILSMMDDGMPITKIAEALGKHKQSVYLTTRQQWFKDEQAKWHGKRENRKEVARQISMAAALDDLHLRFAAMLEECANVLEKGLASEDERVRIDCAKSIIEKAEEAAPDSKTDDTEDSLLSQVTKFLPEGDVQ